MESIHLRCVRVCVYTYIIDIPTSCVCVYIYIYQIIDLCVCIYIYVDIDVQ